MRKLELRIVVWNGNQWFKAHGQILEMMDCSVITGTRIETLLFILLLFILEEACITKLCSAQNSYLTELSNVIVERGKYAHNQNSQSQSAEDLIIGLPIDYSRDCWKIAANHDTSEGGCKCYYGGTFYHTGQDNNIGAAKCHVDYGQKAGEI